MGYTLGLDLGTNSIGWACINVESEQIIAAGVRIFQESIDNKSKLSKNTNRRQKRHLRRQYERKRLRRDDLTEKLKAYQMFSDDSSLKFYDMNPYELRANGLDRQLSKLEFGRVLLHLSKRRGFKSNRKSQTEDTNKSEFKEALNSFDNDIKVSNCRTIGEYLHSLQVKGDKIRCQPTQRQHYDIEYDLLWAKQSLYYPELTDEIKAELKDIIFFQRPLESAARLIGKCALEPDKKRCPKSAFQFQLFRILEQVNRLSCQDENGNEIKLYRSADEELSSETRKLRDELIMALKSKEKMSFNAIRKQLKLDDATFFNLEQDDFIIGDKTSHTFRKIFKKGWDVFSEIEREKILQVINFANDDDWLKKYAMEKWHLDESSAQSVVKIKLEPGYANYSLKAINKILPFLLDGLNLHDARIRAGYENADTGKSQIDIIRGVRNPIVSRTLYEALGLVNSIEKTYGEPALIRVEMARELKASKDQRAKTNKKNRENKEKNERVAEALIALGIIPNHDAIMKYKLWEECKGQCPYTGVNISTADLFSAAFEIEHIIPYCRCCDDSFMNLTLCEVNENRRKGDNTPVECYGGTPQFDDILKRIKVMPKAKQRKFMLTEIDDDFANSQLNDTAYMSREAVRLFGNKFKVQVTKGQVTSQIRHLWGLNSILGLDYEKNRTDHRHHAIDAIVIALTDVKTIQTLSRYSQYKKLPTQEKFPAPWEYFRNDVDGVIKKMLVSIRVNKRLRGQLHEETFYGFTGIKDGKNKQIFRVRKNIADITLSNVEQIADRAIRELIRRALINGTIKSDPPTLTNKHGKGIPIRKVIIHIPASNMIALPGRNKTYVAPGSNHHIIIYRYKDDKGRSKQGGEVCSFFEAVRCFRHGDKVIKKDLGQNKEFLFSLSINEMFILNENEISLDPQNYEEISKKLYRVQKIDAGNIRVTLRRHCEATLDASSSSPTPNTLRGIKVIVDRLGRISKTND